MRVLYGPSFQRRRESTILRARVESRFRGDGFCANGWIPAFAGMTEVEGRRSRLADSAWRRRDAGSLSELRSDSMRQCVPPPAAHWPSTQMHELISRKPQMLEVPSFSHCALMRSGKVGLSLLTHAGK